MCQTLAVGLSFVLDHPRLRSIRASAAALALVMLCLCLPAEAVANGHHGMHAASGRKSTGAVIERVIVRWPGHIAAEQRISISGRLTPPRSEGLVLQDTVADKWEPLASAKTAKSGAFTMAVGLPVASGPILFRIVLARSRGIKTALWSRTVDVARGGAKGVTTTVAPQPLPSPASSTPTSSSIAPSNSPVATPVTVATSASTTTSAMSTYVTPTLSATSTSTTSTRATPTTTATTTSVASPPPQTDLGDTLGSGGEIEAGQYLESSDGHYTLLMQSDGNLVELVAGRVLWSSGTAGNPGARAVMQSFDGNFVVYGPTGTALWNASAVGQAGDHLALQTDADVVVYTATGSVAWSSGLNSTLQVGETLQPGWFVNSPDGQYMLIMQPADGNLVLYHGGTAVWSAGDRGAGASATMQSDGNLVIYTNGVAKWSANTSGFPGAFLAVQNDGNAVIYHSGHPVWDCGGGYLGNQLNGLTLGPGAYLLSPSHLYMLIMQPADGNLVLYQGGTAVWSTGAQGAGSSVTMQSDGNLVIYNNGVAKWSTATSGFAGAYLVLGNDGNVVIYQGSTAIWDWESGRLGGGPGGAAGGEGQTILNQATKWLGTTYCWDGGNSSGPTHGDGYDGGEAPDCIATSTVGFDCTGLALYAVYQATAAAGSPVTLTHDNAQANYALQHGGTLVTNQAALQPGDLVYFGYPGPLSNMTHVGVAIGNGMMIDANTAWGSYSDGVRERSISETEADRADQFLGAVRF